MFEDETCKYSYPYLESLYIYNITFIDIIIHISIILRSYR